MGLGLGLDASIEQVWIWAEHFFRRIEKELWYHRLCFPFNADEVPVSLVCFEDTYSSSSIPLWFSSISSLHFLAFRSIHLKVFRKQTTSRSKFTYLLYMHAAVSIEKFRLKICVLIWAPALNQFLYSGCHHAQLQIMKPGSQDVRRIEGLPEMLPPGRGGNWSAS